MISRRRILGHLPYPLQLLQQRLGQGTRRKDIQILLDLNHARRPDDDGVAILPVQGRMMHHPAQRRRVGGQVLLFCGCTQTIGRLEEFVFEVVFLVDFS